MQVSKIGGNPPDVVVKFTEIQKNVVFFTLVASNKSSSEPYFCILCTVQYSQY